MSTPKQLAQTVGEDEEMMIFAFKKSDLERLLDRTIEDDDWLSILDELDSVAEAADDFAVSAFKECEEFIHG